MRNPEKARHIIVSKSAEVFNVYGFAGATMDKIIQATGYKKGGIYNHFDSKKDLALHAFRHAYSVLKEAYISSHKTQKIKGGFAALLNFVNTYEEFIANPPIKGGCPILNNAVEADDTNPDMKKAVQEAIRDWRNVLEKMIYKGIEDGDIRPDVNPKDEAVFIIAAIEGGIMLAKATNELNIMYAIAASLRQRIQDYR